MPLKCACHLGHAQGDRERTHPSPHKAANRVDESWSQRPQGPYAVATGSGALHRERLVTIPYAESRISKVLLMAGASHFDPLSRTAAPGLRGTPPRNETLTQASAANLHLGRDSAKNRALACNRWAVFVPGRPPVPTAQYEQCQSRSPSVCVKQTRHLPGRRAAVIVSPASSARGAQQFIRVR